MSAQEVIGLVHRLSTLSRFERTFLEEILGAALFPSERPNPELLVATGVLEAGPFGTAEFVEPGPYSRLTERRLVLTPSGPLRFAEIAAWYGPGTPIHLDGRAEVPLATIAYDVDAQEILFTFDVSDGEVRFVTIRRGRA